MTIVVGEMDDEARARLEEAMARMRAREDAMRAAFGCGEIVMMAERSPAAIRKALERERKARDVVLLEGEIDHFTVVDGLIRRNLISDEASCDLKLLSAAAFRFLAEELKK